VELLTNPEVWVALLTLTALEIVLGIDNIIFISILANKLPRGQRDRARQVGIVAAMGMRIALLLGINWVIGLTEPILDVLGQEFSGRDIVLIIGGLFLLAKATWEIHGRMEGDEHVRDAGSGGASFWGVIVQIMIMDIIFSLDSVITAVGMANDVSVMIAAVVIAVIVMLVASGYVTRTIDRHPTLKMLALAFLLLIGVTLVADGLGQHIDKGYIYFAMGFAVFVEVLNIRRSAQTSQPVRMHDPYHERGDAPADGPTDAPTDAPPGPPPATPAEPTELPTPSGEPA
jgi:predicted tellurium resistance membrane protein TerC